MILVAGGTGRLGRLVVAGLTALGEPVRILTRDVSTAVALRGPLVDVVRGDVRDPATLPPAMAGARTVVSAIQGFAGPGGVTPETVDRDGNANLVAAAKAEGSDMVLVSVVGASAGSAMALFRMKAAAEDNLVGSGVPWTIVRASGFLELYLDLMRRTAGKTGRPLVFGRGQNPINFARVSDVADAVVRAAADPVRNHRSGTNDGSGPGHRSGPDHTATTHTSSSEGHITPLLPWPPTRRPRRLLLLAQPRLPRATPGWGSGH